MLVRNLGFLEGGAGQEVLLLLNWLLEGRPEGILVVQLFTALAQVLEQVVLRKVLQLTPGIASSY